MIGVVGGGAFGTALARALTGPVALWARDPGKVTSMPGVDVVGDLALVHGADAVLLCVPMQALSVFLPASGLDGTPLVACCKGLDLRTLEGPSGVVSTACPSSVAAVLSGPSFADDLACGLPTALTLACREDVQGARLQGLLSNAALRVYRTTDVAGVEFGGALKNVVAIAAGVAIGAGLGESARAALMARGFGEIQQIALARGARAETLVGLSGLGDLVLTCTSTRSRNFRYGLALGAGTAPGQGATVEGVATAAAAHALAVRLGLDLPVVQAVAGLVEGRLCVTDAIQSLMARPLRPEGVWSPTVCPM